MLQRVTDRGKGGRAILLPAVLFLNKFLFISFLTFESVDDF